MLIILKKIFTIGVSTSLDFQKKRDIIFLNKVLFFVILIMLSISIVNISFGFYARSLVALSAIPLLTIAMYFQKAQRYINAKVLTITTILLGSFFTTFLFGAEAMTQYYIFASFCISMVIFKKRTQHFAVAILHVGLFCFLNIYIKSYGPLITGQDSMLLSFFHIPMIFTAAFLVLSEYVSHYRRYEDLINDLMFNLKEHSELLQIEKTKFEVQTEILKMTNDKLLIEITNKESIQQKLEESNIALEQFAYVASHDLKEPLRTIGSFIQLIKKRIGGNFDKESNEYFYYVIDGARRMTNLLDDLLSFSQLNGKTEMTTVDLECSLEISLINLKDSIEKNKGEVLVGSMPTIKGNRSQMSQLFQNLISNGLKFKRDIAPIVKIDCEEQENNYLFSIRDNGIGIPEKYHEKVFVIFQRLSKDTAFEGTGIGLSICKKIVQIHGGEIWMESTPDEGTTFFFTIPKSNHSSENASLHKEELLPSLAG